MFLLKSRLTWIFASPNELAVFLAGCLPLIWAVSVWVRHRGVPRLSTPRHWWEMKSSRWLVVLLFSVELVLWVLLGGTASRGGAVGALLAACAWGVWIVYLPKASVGELSGWLGLRFLLCLAGFIVFSYGRRISPEFLSQDASIGNRFVLWIAGARLAVMSPWGGWGQGESGEAFMQWLQPLGRPEGYKTMVNAYLHIGVERGLAVLGLCLGVFGLLVFAPWLAFQKNGVRPIPVLVAAGSSSLVAYAVANFFSTLFFDYRLFALPLLATVAVLGGFPWQTLGKSHLNKLFQVLGIAVLLPLSLVTLVGLFSGAKEESIVVRRGGVGSITLSVLGKSEKVTVWGVVPDVAVLGQKFGHEVRRWGLATNSGDGWKAVVLDPRFAVHSVASARAVDVWLLCGSNAFLADSLPKDAKVVFLHPAAAARLPGREWAWSSLTVSMKTEPGRLGHPGPMIVNCRFPIFREWESMPAPRGRAPIWPPYTNLVGDRIDAGPVT